MTILEHIQRPVIQRILNEIGEKVTPYLKSSVVKFSDNSYKEPFSSFKDDKNNTITVWFSEYKLDCYEVEFSVNGDSMQKFETTTAHYFKILSTVIEIINKSVS